MIGVNMRRCRLMPAPLDNRIRVGSYDPHTNIHYSTCFECFAKGHYRPSWAYLSRQKNAQADDWFRYICECNFCNIKDQERNVLRTQGKRRSAGTPVRESTLNFENRDIVDDINAESLPHHN